MKQHLSKVLFWAECCSRLLVLKPPSSPQTWLLPNGSSAVCLSPPPFRLIGSSSLLWVGEAGEAGGALVQVGLRKASQPLGGAGRFAATETERPL